MSGASALKLQYPLHWNVYLDDVPALSKLLEGRPMDIDLDKLDCRGRTPLMLAVTLGHKKCVYLLLEAGANADAQNKESWLVSHEAVSWADEDVVRDVIMFRDFQRSTRACSTMIEQLLLLKDTPDFYVEMQWEFSSWVPFISQMCPSDTYKIYKKGSSIRLDTTLVGLEGTTWTRGHQSFVFRLDEEQNPQMMVLDHDDRTVSIQTLHQEDELLDFKPTPEATQFRMTTPISTTYIDVDNIGFEQHKGGLLSWIFSRDDERSIDGYLCKKFLASNVNLVTKTRTEHLSEEDKAKHHQEEGSNSVNKVMNIVLTSSTEESVKPVGDSLTAQEYLDETFTMSGDIGRQKHVTKRSNAFKASLSLAQDYPLDLKTQILSIVNLMATNNAHFARLHNFIQLQLPAGFPVKIEVPIFHVMSTTITFKNVNEESEHVRRLPDEPNTVFIEDSLFDAPATYRSMTDDSHFLWPDDDMGDHTCSVQSAMQQEEMLMQWAIEQSVLESTAAGVANHPTTARVAPAADEPPRVLPGYYDSEEAMLAQVMAESLRDSGRPASESPHDTQSDPDLALALSLSRQQAEEERNEEERRLEEELQKALNLSLIDH